MKRRKMIFKQRDERFTLGVNFTHVTFAGSSIYAEYWRDGVYCNYPEFYR